MATKLNSPSLIINETDLVELILSNDPLLLHVIIKVKDYIITGTVASTNIPNTAAPCHLVKDESFQSSSAELTERKYLIFGNLKKSAVIAFKLVDVTDNTVALFATPGDHIQPSEGIGMFSGPVDCFRSK